MAIKDITIIKGRKATLRMDVDDRTTSGASATIKPGEPIKKSGNFAVILGDGEPTITAPMIGIAAEESTETATVDGYVDYYPVIPGETIMRAKVTTAANMDTAAELLGIKGDAVAFDLATGTFTVDENEGDDPNVHGLLIVDGDIANGTVDFMLKQYASEFGSSY